MKTLLLALAALLLAGCQRQPPGPIIDPALLTLVPSDTTLLVGVRVEDVMKTPVYQHFLADRAVEPLDEFAREIGVEFRKSLWEVLFVSNGVESVMLGRGKFSSEAEPRLPREAAGAKRFSYRGYTLVGDERHAVLLMGPTLVGVGATQGLKRVIDTRDKTNGPPQILTERIREIPREAGVWSVFTGSPVQLPENAAATAGNLARVLGSMESGLFYLDLRNGVAGKASGLAPSEAAAKELYEALRGMLGLARLMTSKGDVSMERFFDGLRVTQDGAAVHVYIDQPEEAITTVLDLVRGMRAGL
jgi:hypothetical protein